MEASESHGQQQKLGCDVDQVAREQIEAEHSDRNEELT